MARFLKHHNRVIFAPLFFRILLGQPAMVEVAANLIRLLSYQNKNMLQAGVIVGGWDKYEGGQIYSVPWLGARVGSGHQFTSLKATSYAPLLSI
ncbi:Proteasome subunit beta type-6 [Carex littledalei]|uniref:Proteasome subunit beta type-6 n=1 Tax=Carex littledalei TaxID=544730 RepID=A0A833QLZ2_9POAL|nr:Proteasome subunit beta type-6 [Carex littledalei]